LDGPTELPQKLFFKIGEVARIVGVEPYVLRYWETEFKEVRPQKSRGRQRLYRRSDVHALLQIKRLLRDEGLTIAGARKRILAERAADREGERRGVKPQADPQVQRLVDEIERLKQQCAAAAEARTQAVRRAAARDELLRGVRKEVQHLLADVERLRARASGRAVGPEGGASQS
jgi:DNA-binding transcriptional MerR regulator